MKHVLKVQITDSSENMENLPHYEVMSVAIRKMMSLVMLKIKNEQQKPLTNDDKILIYELASSCQLLCRQSSLFEWSKVEVKEFNAHSRTRRSPQEKIIDRQISTLFPTESLKTFIAIIFRDMNIAQQIFDPSMKSPSEESETAFIKVKNNKAREAIKQFLGDYLSKCKKNKFELLELLMKGVIFEKKKLRESYLQEVLKTHEIASYSNALEQYILDKKLGFVPDERERIYYLTWTLTSYNQNMLFENRLLVLTNKGVHIMKPPQGKPCNICPPEKMCPTGPLEEYKFKYGLIVELLTFASVPQKFQAFFSRGEFLETKDLSLSANFIIPNTSTSLAILKLAKEIAKLQQTPFHDDYMVYGSIISYLAPNSTIKFARYVTHNPTKSFFGFKGEESLIPNCSLLVVSNTQIWMFKENWSKWHNVNNYEILEMIIDKMQTPKLDDDEEPEILSMAQKMQDMKLKSSLKGTLQPVFKRELTDLEDLQVHKGKDPAVELHFPKQVEKVTFKCDFTRQQFIELIIELKSGRKSE